MGHTLEKDILTTIVYWDVFSFPLTAFEVWQYRISASRLSGKENAICEEASLNEVMRVLRTLEYRGIIAQTDGVFFLKGREALAEHRRSRGKISDRKLRSLRRVVSLLRFLPFVRMIGVTGRLSFKNIGQGSDWDVLIILKSGRIWTGRTLITGFLHSIGKRRWGRFSKDRVCLNHFLTDQHLEVPLKDLFAAREYAFLLPLYGWDIFQEFEKRNDWIREFLPEWKPSKLSPLPLIPDSFTTRIVRGIGEILFDFNRLEGWLRGWQSRKIKNNPKTHLPQGFIRATDEALIFLPDPQGPKVFEKFMGKLQSLSSK